MHLVSLRKEEFSEVGTVLTGDTGNQGAFCHVFSAVREARKRESHWSLHGNFGGQIREQTIESTAKECSVPRHIIKRGSPATGELTPETHRGPPSNFAKRTIEYVMDATSPHRSRWLEQKIGAITARPRWPAVDLDSDHFGQSEGAKVHALLEA
ncbi:hypothetical protein [Microbacterium testaceum]|uniref:hypothetical protein n=1 Tax=Microbacterium testaceum TaxID=2033 RepID=UPI00187BFC90|nr:hypothetical protein [Microbacterium testaceum]